MLHQLDLIAACLCGHILLDHKQGRICWCGRCLCFRPDTLVWPVGVVVAS